MRFVAAQKADLISSPNAVLILFTDGQQVGDGFNMEKKAPSSDDLKTAASNDFIPDLHGVRMIFTGVTPSHGIDNAHWRKIQSFWKEYGKKALALNISVSSERTIILER